MNTRKLDQNAVFSAALKFSSRSEFKRLDNSAYKVAQRNGWLDLACAHMNPLLRRLDKETVLRIAKNFSKRKDFELLDRYAYKFARLNGFLDEACEHMDRLRKSYRKELVVQIALKYKTRSTFKKMCGGAYRHAANHGYLDEACKHMKVTRRDLTKDDVSIIAKNFQTRREFYEGDQGAYSTARRKGWLKDVCRHMSHGNYIFSHTKEAYLYHIKFLMPNGSSIWKIGISNKHPLHRLKQLGVPDWVTPELTKFIKYEVGADARNEEKRLIEEGRSKGISYEGDPFLKSGNTELFTSPLM